VRPDSAFGVEADEGQALAERPIRLADVDAVCEVLRIRPASGHDDDVVAVDESDFDKQCLQLAQEEARMLRDEP
jgi:hypothetical protein